MRIHVGELPLVLRADATFCQGRDMYPSPTPQAALRCAWGYPSNPVTGSTPAVLSA